MFGKKSTGTITFYYDSNVMFDDVSRLSSFMAKNLSESEGTAIDKFAITDDEKEVYAVCVKQSLTNVYDVLMKLSSGVENAFSDEVEVKTDETDGLERKAGKYIELNIQNNRAHNVNVLQMVDTTVLMCLQYGILAQFYSVNLNADLYRIAKDKLNESLSKLRMRLFQLKRKPVSPLM